MMSDKNTTRYRVITITSSNGPLQIFRHQTSINKSSLSIERNNISWLESIGLQRIEDPNIYPIILQSDKNYLNYP